MYIYFFKITPKHVDAFVPSRNESKFCAAVQIDPLLSQLFTNSHFHFFIIGESATSHVLCCSNILGGDFAEKYLDESAKQWAALDLEMAYFVFTNERILCWMSPVIIDAEQRSPVTGPVWPRGFQEV
jgi:hypothetical protein